MAYQGNKATTAEDLSKAFNQQSVGNLLKMKEFLSFEDNKEALKFSQKLEKGKITKKFKKSFKKLAKTYKDIEFATDNMKLASALSKKFKANCLYNELSSELIRKVGENFNEIDETIAKQNDIAQMGLGYKVARHTLMFSTENIDTMVIQAVTLLDNVEKELNSYIQRIKEWYGWHFPELLKTFADPLSYLAFITAFGSRKEFIATMNSVEKSKYSKILQNKLLDDVITEDMLEEIISLADTSIGLDLNFEDCEAIQLLCKQALELAKYKMQLTDYLSMRMNDICPNLTEVLGNTLGAKMLSHVGSLSNLASKPGSTIQILGAEKALFKAIKSRGNTPKYGLIYNAPLVQQVNKQDRGKIARSLAAKAALAARLDYNQEDKTGKNGAMMKKKMELRIRQLKKAANPKDKPQFQSKKMHSFQKRGYNQKMDSAKPFSKIRKDE